MNVRKLLSACKSQPKERQPKERHARKLGGLMPKILHATKNGEKKKYEDE